MRLYIAVVFFVKIAKSEKPDLIKFFVSNLFKTG